MIAVLLAAGLTFHPVTIAQINADACDHWTKVATHLQVDGWVTYKAKEEDGDWHLRVCDDPKIVGPDKAHCFVAEIIPAIPLKSPKVGQHVRVQGIYRYDAETPNHGWNEVHPVLHIEVIP